MRRFPTRLLAAIAAVAASIATPACADPLPPTEPAADFLTDVTGAHALDWVRAQNRHTFDVLQSDPRYDGFRSAALAVAQAPDRIATPGFVGHAVYNFWQDASHRRGIWRRSDLESYAADHPRWTTVLDLDALAAREHRDWVWKGDDCGRPGIPTCLIELSIAGEDASVFREIDPDTGAFVANGFDLPRSKQAVAWVDRDHVLVARDWGAVDGASSMTASGYPFIVRRWTRGTGLDQATELFRGRPSDVGVLLSDDTDGTGRRATLIEREVTFFDNEFLLLTPHGLVKLHLPPKTEPAGFVAGRLVFELRQSVPQAGSIPPIAAGSLVSIPVDAPDAAPSPVFTPGPRQAFEDAVSTGGALVAVVNDNVRGRAYAFAPDRPSAPSDGPDPWHARRIALPDDVSLKPVAGEVDGDAAFLVLSGFVTPSQLWLVDASAATARVVHTLPAEFDSSGLVVEQRETPSTDGTRIPYFLVHRAGMAHDGSNPTLLTAYGGFQIPSLPTYDGIVGRLWLARGGSYALANIRGGGEFGPAWHEAGRKTKRQHVFDDFAAVGRDLIASGVTSPRRLGIRGRSNGGLLMGVEFTQHPEMWHAVVIGVPLLDMEHFETMAAGASWVDEYGSMSVADERRFLERISPLQALRPGVAYPTPFIFTSTRDDRVGPVHARRFAWRLSELGDPFFYYEDTEGGHSGTVNAPEIAHERALEAVYLSRQLMDPAQPGTAAAGARAPASR